MPLRLTPGCVLCDFWEGCPYKDIDMQDETPVASASKAHAMLMSGYLLAHTARHDVCRGHRRVLDAMAEKLS